MAGTGTASLRDRDALLAVEDLRVDFGRRARRVSAVAGVSFDVLAGETLGLVGESGCGKSTTLRSVLQLPPPTSGTVRFEGQDLARLSKDALRRVRPRLQVVSQDPASSLNPKHSVREIVAEPLRVWRTLARSEIDDRVDDLLEAVGIAPRSIGRRGPHEFSGGQQQRISIARALALEPRLILCDEAVSSLDVSVRAQILNLLHDMKARFGLALLFVAHDLAVAKNISDRVAVMYMGKLCEIGRADAVYAEPRHPYTSLLLDSVPSVTRPRRREADSTSRTASQAMAPGVGCPFRDRCPRAEQRCHVEEPVLRAMGDDHFVACHAPTWTPLGQPSAAVLSNRGNERE